MLSAIADAIAERAGRRLATRDQMGRHWLAPRANQTLSALLAGDSEKQIAARLEVAISTVHDHVCALYRDFGVHSRGELTAYFLRRQPTEPPARKLARAHMLRIARRA